MVCPECNSPDIHLEATGTTITECECRGCGHRWEYKGTSDDPVNHPKHYTSHPSGIECITITRHMSFNVGNAMKYLWRADEKGAPIEDLQKAKWYIEDEIRKREMNNGK